MLRNKFDKQLETLNLELVHMGALVERAIDDSAKALIDQNLELAHQVITQERGIDALKNEIESKALKILLTQQPVARDLRTISAALKIITDLERIGDQARDLCDIVIALYEEEYQPKLEILPQMAELSRVMVRDSVDSFVKQDIVLAKKVIETDDKMDELFSQLKKKMIKMLKTKSDHADQMIYFLMAGKYLEKIGDHAENIAQWVIFAKTGERKSVKIL